MRPRVRDYHNYITMDHTHLADLVLTLKFVYQYIFHTIRDKYASQYEKSKKKNYVLSCSMDFTSQPFFLLQKRYLTEHLVGYPWDSRCTSKQLLVHHNSIMLLNFLLNMSCMCLSGDTPDLGLVDIVPKQMTWRCNSILYSG